MNRRAPGLLLIGGGAIMAALWPLFTSLHGPTSVNEEREFLGQDPLFWGAMMEGPSSLLIAVGLVLLSPILWTGGSRPARIGYALVLVSLLVPGVIDILILALVPPLLYPFEAVGLVLLASGGRMLPRPSRVVLGVMAALLLASLWQVFVTEEQWDALNGYRIFGLMSNLLVGVGWVGFGAILLRQNSDLQNRAAQTHLQATSPHVPPSVRGIGYRREVSGGLSHASRFHRRSLISGRTGHGQVAERR